MLVLKKGMNIFIYKSHLFLVCNLGIVVVEVSIFLDKLFIYYNNNFLGDKALDNDFKSLIKKVITNFTTLFKQKLLLFGIGFRYWILKNSIILKLGFSNDMFVAVPSYVKIICLKSSVFLLKSCNKVKLSQYITLLCKSRIPDVYKGKGILYSDKKVFLKQGKHN